MRLPCPGNEKSPGTLYPASCISNKTQGTIDMNKTFEVAVLVGSLRKDSINRKLAHAITRLAPDNLSFRFIEIRDLPFYDSDLDEGTPPAEWTRFRDEMKAV